VENSPKLNRNLPPSDELPRCAADKPADEVTNSLRAAAAVFSQGSTVTTDAEPIANGGITLEDANVASETILESKPLDSDSKVSAKPHIPSVSASAVLGESASMPEGTPECHGHDFSESTLLDHIMDSMRTTGFQATNVGLAVDQIRELRKWRLDSVPWKEGDDPALQSPEARRRIRARIFFAYTSNQISSGQREVIRFLVKNKMVDVIVTTAGGIEEDLVKCFQPTYMGDFKLRGRDLRKKGINRIGNLLVPNKNYCQFEDWITPIITKMHDEQDKHWLEWAHTFLKHKELGKDCSPPTKFVWTPSKVIERLGREINNEDSVLYWASKNNIPVFSPALTDGSLGDMLYFHSYKRPGFVLDIAEDIRAINDLSVRSHATGQIILGGGLVKHHTCNANLMRNGADYSVYINTGNEFDGSDSGASPDEAISWGKIRINAKPVKVCADATIVFPLVVSQTFAKDVAKWREETKDCVCWVDDL
jgi:deoxyhypusine synthase